MDDMAFECIKQDCVWSFNETNCEWACKSNCSCEDGGASGNVPSSNATECSFSCEEFKDLETRVKIVESYIGGGGAVAGEQGQQSSIRV